MGIKNRIRQTSFGEYIVLVLHYFASKIMPKLINDEKYIKKSFKKKSGKELDLDNPITLSEKLHWYKYTVRDPLMVKCSDKYAVRDYICERGYSENLNKVYGIYNSVDEIDINKLPERFVLKATHGSHMNIIVKDKNQMNWKQENRKMRLWLKQDIYWSGREWAYRDIPHRIMAEEYLEDTSGELKDYKFFCFNGRPFFMLYVSNRYTGQIFINFYDSEMNLIDVRYKKFPNNPKAKMPITEQQFNEMKQMAINLAKPFQEVRVDFYLLNNKIYVGELTFYSGGGYNWYIPERYDEVFGSYWQIEK